MKTERVTQKEILAAIRQTGTGLIEDVDAVVLETDGSLSVIGKIKESQTIVTSNVKNRIKIINET